MKKIDSEYDCYQSSSVMKKLASIAHEHNYIEQTSSATYDEIACMVKKMLLPSNSLVLDAGCGNGAFSLPLAKDFSFIIEGVDLSQKLIEAATKKAAKANLTSKCRFSVRDFTQIADYPNASFDLIISIGSLYWGQSLTDTLTSWHRIIRSDGALLLFLNLSYKPLNFSEKSSIGSTQFIPALYLAKELTKSGWTISEWLDGTNSYISWLERWCSAMENMKDDITAEMGKESALQLVNRFTTYRALAKKGIVRRIVLRAEHV